MTEGLITEIMCSYRGGNINEVSRTPVPFCFRGTGQKTI